MIVILFRSRLTGQAGEDYDAMDARMLEKARAAPGFVDVKSYTAADGERLTVVRWQDAETLRAWREDPAHREAQATGRRLWYEWYDMEVAEVVRESRFARRDAPAALR
ncbi:MAG TPA: antibiotic biosynthesis monooxygenase [Thermoanaerobaculia bacterium]|nr:antibiotic biosynthesis monooxygenase [Thermoanaerobaculia bacterium]